LADDSKAERNISQTSQYPCVFVLGGQQENSPDDKSKTTTNGKKPNKWSQIELKDRLVIELTAGIFVVAALTAYLFLRQANIMQGQLEEMRDSGQQVDRQIILSQGQMILAGHQTADTDILADSSKKSIETTRDSIRLDQRAWIVLRGLDGVPQLNQPWSIKAYLINTGRTPAKNVRVSCNVEPSASEAAASFHELPYQAATLYAPGDPGNYCEMFPLTIPTMNQKALDLLANKQDIMFVFGSASYEDIFKRPHWMTFCRVMHPDGKAWDRCTAHPDDTGDGIHKQK
jgi:hypothetical protein